MNQLEAGYRIDTGDLIYLDHAATTPVDPVVLAAMTPWHTQQFGNPSSIYQLGQEGHYALDQARSRVARILNCQSAEVLFTGGATESNNLAIAGVAWQVRLSERNVTPHVITTAIEHHAVLHPTDRLTEQGFEVTVIPVDGEGFVDPSEIAKAILPSTRLISVMYANNEVGTIQPIAEIGRIAKEHGITFHCDAVQAAGALSLDVDALSVDLLSLSAHKFYGPKGVGVLYVRSGTPIAWQQLGGGQESGRRGSTENVAGIVGLSLAFDRAEQATVSANQHNSVLRDQLAAGILEKIDGVKVNGPLDFARKLANNLNVAVEGVQGETALLALDMLGIAASAGSACTTGNAEPSHVLLAMGRSESTARSSLRFTVGRCNTVEQMEDTVDALRETVERIRRLGGR